VGGKLCLQVRSIEFIERTAHAFAVRLRVMALARGARLGQLALRAGEPVSGGALASGEVMSPVCVSDRM
jgi:hypothetical protein